MAKSRRRSFTDLPLSIMMGLIPLSNNCNAANRPAGPARDIFYLLNRKGVFLESKPFALGVRIEHPQDLIDQIQYKQTERGDFLPPAAYSLVTQVNNGGVFSFCMCPGGIIAPCATSDGEIVVNGWSPSKRNGQFANSGTVVSVNTTDWQKLFGEDVLGALKFQEMV